MSTIKGQPYFQAKFDKDGASLNNISLPAGTTDVFVISHGWRNDENGQEFRPRRLPSTLYRSATVPTKPA